MDNGATAANSGDILYSGTYTNGIVLSNPTTQNPSTIAASGLVTNTGTALYGTPVAAWSVGNLGTVEGTGTAGVGIALAFGGSIANAGLITGYRDGVLIGNAVGTVSNSGTIEATNLLREPGVDLTAGGSISNFGSISGIQLGAGGSMTNSSSGTIGRDVTISNGTGAIANSGLILGQITLNAGGSVMNNDGGTINGSVIISNSAGALANSGSIVGGVQLDAGGSVTNAEGGVIAGGALIGRFPILSDFPAVDVSGAAGTVTNYGILNDGVDLEAGGTFTNLGTIDHGFADAQGKVVGVSLSAGGTVANGAGALIAGYYEGLLAYGDTALANFGTIASAGGGYSGGVYLGSGGTVTNAGTITGYYNGVGIAGATGALVNYGRIAAIGAYGLGVYLGGDGSTLVNAGRIVGAGGAAVYVAGSYSTLTVAPGAVFAGRVAASGSYDTLELAAGARAGTLSGLGTKFDGFYALGVDPGAVWQLSGSAPDMSVVNDGTIMANGRALGLGPVTSDPGASGAVEVGEGGAVDFFDADGPRDRAVFTDASGTMRLFRPLAFLGRIFGFRPGDTIDLAQRAADEIGFADHRLIVAENGATMADLRFAGPHRSSDFALSPDGQGGTDITLLPPDPLAMKG
jgi:fibronectin-binding autotransporter adhesin